MIYIFTAMIVIAVLCWRAIVRQRAPQTRGGVLWLLLCVIVPPVSWYECIVDWITDSGRSPMFAALLGNIGVLLLLICFSGLGGLAIAGQIPTWLTAVYWFAVPATALASRRRERLPSG